MQFNHGENNLRYGKKKCIVIKAASSVHAQRDVLIVIPLGGSPIIASLMNIVTTIPLPPTSLSPSLSHWDTIFFLFIFLFKLLWWIQTSNFKDNCNYYYYFFLKVGQFD